MFLTHKIENPSGQTDQKKKRKKNQKPKWKKIRLKYRSSSFVQNCRLVINIKMKLKFNLNRYSHDPKEPKIMRINRFSFPINLKMMVDASMSTKMLADS